MESPIQYLLDRLSQTESGCLLWTGYKNKWGYGVVTYQQRKYKLHRLVYQQLVGPIPAGLTLDHLCRNRACANPAHLECVTLEENQRRGHWGASLNAAKTHCCNGHEFTDANTRIDKDSFRRCRACEKLRTQKRRS